jgi:hypothetical protein
MPDRIERDSIGEIAVPADRLWGAQTQRSLIHFAISTERMPPELLLALAQVKRCCAIVNRALGRLPADKADAIIAATDEILAGLHAAEFPLSVWQTGSGTQTNMNMNEVLANRGSELLGGVRGAGRQPGELRQSQNWIGGMRPGNAVFVPPPADQVPGLLADLERFIHAPANDLPDESFCTFYRDLAVVKSRQHPLNHFARKQKADVERR